MGLGIDTPTAGMETAGRQVNRSPPGRVPRAHPAHRCCVAPHGRGRLRRGISCNRTRARARFVVPSHLVLGPRCREDCLGGLAPRASSRAWEHRSCRVRHNTARPHVAARSRGCCRRRQTLHQGGRGLGGGSAYLKEGASGRVLERVAAAVPGAGADGVVRWRRKRGGKGVL